ncbi:uncharacterized protein LOC124118436 isoform X2 [Haliotis rufescens]|nr:uncharacterized protein LOC124118436 isoform X2 [Haliotis rufescens]XP_046336516.2 uncharacterized protein LOC124118436 isoform X2 [Haliotis rufescens]XP_048258888.1 uncharacterized protein LOC124118436 isoform X2 [Haliotis rufescens]
MTHPKDSDVEAIPVVVSSDERRKKDTEDDRIDEDGSQRRANLGVDPGHCLPPSETGESVPGDMPRLQQTAPVGAVKGENIILKEEAGSEPSSGTDNGDDENVKRLDEALSRLDVKDEDDPEGMPHSSLVSATQLRVPETESSDTSLDAQSNECGAKGSERLSESSLESDGNVSDVESDIDSDGICSISDPSPPRDSQDQLVARGPTREHTLQSRHQGKPYDRQSTSPHIVTKEQDDELKMLLETSPASYDGSQHSSPPEAFDQNYVDDWLDTLEPQDTSSLKLFNGNDSCVSAQHLTGSMASPGRAGLDSSGRIINSHVPTQQCANVFNSPTSDPALTTMTTTPCALIFPSSSTANIPRPDDSMNMSGSQAPMQSTIPTVVEEKINESETDPKKNKKRTSRKKRGTPTPRKVATKSECQSSVQQTPPPITPMLSQGLVSATPIESSNLLMDAMHLIANELSNNPPNGTPVTQTHQEVMQQWLHASDTQTACVPMHSDPAHPVQQLPVFSQSPHSVLQAPPSVQSRQLCLPQAPQQPATTIYLNQDTNIDVQQVAQIAIQSSPHHLCATPWGNNDVQHVAPDVQVLHQQPGIPPLASTATMSYGTSQHQMFPSRPTMMANAGLRPLVPSSGQYKLTTAGSLGATSYQLFAFPFQPVRPVRSPTEPTSRLQKIVPKPT